MASDGNAFEILPDPQLEDLTSSLETRCSDEKIIDDNNASLPPSKRIPKNPVKTAIAPQVVKIIFRHHVTVNEENLRDEALLQRYCNSSLKGDDYDLTFLRTEMY